MSRVAQRGHPALHFTLPQYNNASAADVAPRVPPGAGSGHAIGMGGHLELTF